LHQQTGILLSYGRFRALLSKHNYVWRQPKHDLTALQDPHSADNSGLPVGFQENNAMAASVESGIDDYFRQLFGG
jgi:hypothetical protein